MPSESDVEQLFRLLEKAPPRSAEIVKRWTLEGMSVEHLAGLFEIDEHAARILIFRSLVDVGAEGAKPLSDAEEGKAIETLFSSQPSGSPERQLAEQLTANKDAVKVRLRAAAEQYAQSPKRRTEEWLRRLAIAVVLALTAYFYHREQLKGLPPPEKRPTIPVQAP